MTAPALAQALRVRPLTVVPQGEDFLVGDPASGTYVVLPEIGVRVIELLRTGVPLAEVATAAAARAGTDVDVMDFAATLCELGFAEAVPPGPAPGVETPGAQAPGGDDRGGGARADEAGPRRRRWGVLVVGAPAWVPAGLAALACTLAFVLRPGLLPSANDIFFLSTPVRSLMALTVLTYVLRGAHEGCHWLAARAEGVPARIRVDRRLYMLVFETDLTGLWGLPRRRRYWPLLIGMGFDAVVLAGVLAARLAATAGWWHPAPLAARVLAALTFLQVAGIATQFFIFLRTDVYAVFVTAAGCFNLWEVTRLLLRHRLRLARPTHRATLAAAHPRDRAVARWYLWLYAAGMLFAAWFFVAYFAPATLHLLRWLGGTLLAGDPRRLAFWEAAGFGLLILSPRLLTLGVAVRDGMRRWRARPMS